MARRIRDPFEYVDDTDGAPRFTSRPVVRPQQSKSREPAVIWSTQPEAGAGTRQEQTQSMNPHAAILGMNLAGPSQIHSAAAAANDAIAREMQSRVLQSREMRRLANARDMEVIRQEYALKRLAMEKEMQERIAKVRAASDSGTVRRRLINGTWEIA